MQKSSATLNPEIKCHTEYRNKVRLMVSVSHFISAFRVALYFWTQCNLELTIMNGDGTIDTATKASGSKLLFSKPASPCKAAVNQPRDLWALCSDSCVSCLCGSPCVVYGVFVCFLFLFSESFTRA